jgi:hypothetical protein
MYTVIRTATFLSDVKASSLSEEEEDEIVAAISKNPLAGDIMKGTGGCRKIRFAGREKGKSGGYRTVHYFAGEDVPVLLLALINKGESANLSKAERNALQRELKGYASDYRDGVAEKIAQMRADK